MRKEAEAFELKIKTITCHKVYNVGASLQAYALVRYLSDMGHDVEIIDYQPEYLCRHYRLNVINNPKYDYPLVRQLYLLAKLPHRLKERRSQKKINFDEFEKKYLPLTDKCYRSNEDLKENPPSADIYLAGSDQIWNTIFQNGKDPAFYLDFAPKGSIKASYAASFAIKDIQEEWKENVKFWIEQLDFISVRESSGVKIIEKLGVNKAVQVMDPVFLLHRSIWEELSGEFKVKEPYLLIYDFENSEDIKCFARKIAKERRLKMYAIFRDPLADCCFAQAGPLEFLKLIRGAEYVVSNSFHATAFAIIFEKPFAVFERKEQINTRMRDILELLNLKKNNDELKYHTIMENQIDKSKEYLKKILDVASEKGYNK